MTNSTKLFSAAILTTVLITVLIIVMTLGAIPALAADLPVAAQVAKLSAGENVKVRLNSGKDLKGRLGSVTADRFTLEPRGASQGTARVIKFSEARSVKTDGGGMSTGAKIGITAGVIAGAFLILDAVVAGK